MSVFLHGLALSGYRSFGPNIQRMGPFAKINLFAGANNSGKSNILRFLRSHVGLVRLPMSKASGAQLDPPHDDYRNVQCKPVIGIGIPKSHAHFGKYKSQPHEGNLAKLLSTDLISHGTELAWFDCEITNGSARQIYPDFEKLLTALPGNAWSMLHQIAKPNARHSGPTSDTATAIFDAINSRQVSIPAVFLLPAVRRIEDKSVGIAPEFQNGIIDKLSQLQHPHHSKQEHKESFQRIQAFVRTIVGDESAVLEVPHERDTIHVILNGRTLPLENLGTGVSEVIVLAAAATVISDSIICLEEPELHLHPVLQRKLLSYLAKETSNQYFITTHSAALLDLEGAACFRVQLIDSQTVVTTAERAADRFEICRDLGYKASDLLQANCVIWVEGPSDRLYLRHWIKSIARELAEGIHYSIMFYGGRLLCHLSADDPEVDEFISLCRLNRNLAMLMDSDKRSDSTELNDTKKRIREEFHAPGFVWVTAGREIENYIPVPILSECVELVRPGFGGLVNGVQYERALPRIGNKGPYVDKIKVAHQVIKRDADLDQLDLQQRVEELVQFIRKSNT